MRSNTAWLLLALLPMAAGCHEDAIQHDVATLAVDQGTGSGKAALTLATCGGVGSNTTLVNGLCVASASVCQGADVFDPDCNCCRVAAYGTLISQLAFGAPPSAPAGLMSGGTRTCRYPVGPTIETPTALDPAFSVGDAWASCTGTATWYKTSTKLNGKPTYRHVVDVTTCVPNSQYSVYWAYSHDGTAIGAAVDGLVGAAGGLPNGFVTDETGRGHWERVVDANVWMKFGAPAAFPGMHGPSSLPSDPGIASASQPGILTFVFFNDNAQSNLNPGACEPVNDVFAYDPVSNPCANPQPLVIRLPSVKAANLKLDPGFPLRMLQPY